MRTHLQGTFLLILLLLAFWHVLGWSTAVIGDALSGESRAISAVPRTIDPASYDPLDNREVAALQAALAEFGYDAGPLDGILGPRTRAAVDQAKAALGLETRPDRLLLQTLTLDPSGRDTGGPIASGHGTDGLEPG